MNIATRFSTISKITISFSLHTIAVNTINHAEVAIGLNISDFTLNYYY